MSEHDLCDEALVDLRRRLNVERVLADDLAAAAHDVEGEWMIRGDGGCEVKYRDALSAALARYREARQR